MRLLVKKLLSILLVLGNLVLSLCGCVDKTVTLRILTEAPSQKAYSINWQLDELIERFKAVHENVTVIVECLPKSDNERKIILEQVRTEIMAGKGPDLFILPTEGTDSWFDGEMPADGRDIEPLFSDVNQAMRNGLFADISKFYDEDTELGKDALNSTVMDAGVVNGKRYTLPLYYNIPVIYIYPEQLKEAGIDISIFRGNSMDMLDQVSKSGLDWLAAGTEQFDLDKYILNHFSQLIDYDQQQVTLTKEALTEFINAYCSCRELQGSVWSRQPRASYVQIYDTADEYWPLLGNGIGIWDMTCAVENAYVSKIMDVEIQMLPLAGADGSVIADVTYFGAIGAGCKEPELAYELLRGLLSEEIQWQDMEAEMPQKDNLIFQTLRTEGWPVRAEGAANRMYRNFYKYHLSRQGDVSKDKELNNALRNADVSDEDVGALLEVDKARFPISLESELGIKVKGLNNRFSGNDGSKIDTVVDEFLRELEWHVGEG